MPSWATKIAISKLRAESCLLNTAEGSIVKVQTDLLIIFHKIG